MHGTFLSQRIFLWLQPWQDRAAARPPEDDVALREEDDVGALVRLWTSTSTSMSLSALQELILDDMEWGIYKCRHS